ncbi:hypothetical protein LTR08_007248 [Meristemomyces frigidus]|nr:hypothetical protein LTR08_007248 [Meristemomyces frigidus]
MAAPHGLRHLIRVLDERDVRLGHDDVAWAFEGSTRSEIETWVQEYLSPASLLTHEELTFHRKQPRHSRDQNTTSSGRPLSDTDFEAAITSLEASTAAIDKQCQLMELQKDALRNLKARRSRDNSTDQAHSQRRKKLTREKAQLEFDVNELADSLSSALKSASKQSDVALDNLPPSVEKIFEKDDRLLDGLQTILPKLADVRPSQDTEAEVDRLCQALIALTAQEVRSRLDAAYRSAVSPHAPHENGNDASAETQKTSLQAELDELSSEIDSLATMAVDAHYRLPIVRELQTAHADSELERAKWSEYTLSALHFLTTRLEALADHHDHLHAHRAALQTVKAALGDLLATATSSSSANQPPQSQAPATPVARGLKPLRLVQANLSEDPTSHLLRHLDLRIPTDTTSHTPKLATTLSRAVREREQRLTDLGRTTEQSLAALLAETLRGADADVGDLVGAVYAYSVFGGVGIVGEGVRAGVEGLEAEVGGLGEEIRGLGEGGGGVRC